MSEITATENFYDYGIPYSLVVRRKCPSPTSAGTVYSGYFQGLYISRMGPHVPFQEFYLDAVDDIIDYGARKRDGIGNRSHDLHRPSTFQF